MKLAHGLAVSMILVEFGQIKGGYTGRMNILLAEADKEPEAGTCHRLEFSLRQELKNRNLPEELRKVLLAKFNCLKVNRGGQLCQS